jgi:hypothetical protein
MYRDVFRIVKRIGTYFSHEVWQFVGLLFFIIWRIVRLNSSSCTAEGIGIQWRSCRYPRRLQATIRQPLPSMLSRRFPIKGFGGDLVAHFSTLQVAVTRWPSLSIASSTSKSMCLRSRITSFSYPWTAVWMGCDRWRTLLSMPKSGSGLTDCNLLSVTFVSPTTAVSVTPVATLLTSCSCVYVVGPRGWQLRSVVTRCSAYVRTVTASPRNILNTFWWGHAVL